ncbi:MAG: hypothetical protein JF609_12300 [Verrucomicrobia bacterium]|nr:hypothetical protein [Verrucomicrobiota bacterium]
MKTIIAGFVLFVFGVLVIPLLVVGSLVLQKSGDVQFKVPGTAEANVEKPGRYYLWNDYETIYNGKTYHNSKHLPGGLEIKIIGPDGADLPLVSDASITMTSNGNSKDAIGYVEVAHPGKVKIAVTGDSEERIFSFARSTLLRLFGVISGGVILCAFFAVIGAAVAIWGFVKLVRCSK